MDDSTFSVEDLKDYIITRTNEQWDKSRSPYYLSNISPELQKRSIDYRTVIFPETLKLFVQSRLHDAVRVITHPNHKAKVATVPVGVEYEFDTPIQASFPFKKATIQSDVMTSSTIKGRDALLGFLEALSKLSKDEIDQVVIPTRVLIRLSSDR